MATIRVTRDAESAEFYDATARGELLLRRCDPCAAIYPPAVVHCAVCSSTALSTIIAAGSAELVSWAVPHTREGDVVAVAGLVQLTEGPWIRAQLVDTPHEMLATGLALAVCFLEPEPSVEQDAPHAETLPAFTAVR